MKRHILSKAVIISVITGIIFIGCAKKDDGKIPISTKSKEARDLFIEGRDFADRLQAQESKHYFEQAVEKDPNFAMALLYLSFAQTTTREFFEYLDKAKAASAEISEGEKLWILGFEAGALGLPGKQKEYYDKLVTLYPNDERAHNLLGLYYFGQQEYQQAIAEFQKSIAIAPNFSQPYNQMGYAYRFTNHYPEAEAAFKKYIELIPNDPNPYDSYAELLLKMGKFKESIDNYAKALQQNPNFVNSFLGTATDYNLMGEYDNARAALQKLMDIARNNGEKAAALFAMTVSYVMEGNYEKALECQNQQLELHKGDNDPAGIAGDLNIAGMIMLDMGKYDNAQKNFDESMQTVQASTLGQEVKDNAKRIYLNNSARADLLKKNFEGAMAKSNELLELAQQTQNALQIKLAHELKGMIALAQKDYDSALAELNQANQLNPYNFYRMGLAYEGKGDKEKAKEYYAQAVNFNSLNDINLAFCRPKALKALDKIK